MVYTLLPDKFSKSDDNKSGILQTPTGICSDPNDASSIYITDATSGKVYRLKLYCPAVVTETKKMKLPIACRFAVTIY